MPASGRNDCDDALSVTFSDSCNLCDLSLDALSPGYCTAAGLEDVPWEMDSAEGSDVV